jgi:hypothetical protein
VAGWPIIGVCAFFGLAALAEAIRLIRVHRASQTQRPQ